MASFESRVARARDRIKARATEDGVERATHPADVNIRDLTKHGGKGYLIVGHGAVFNRLSDDLGGFREKIAPGAFGRVLGAKPDVRQLFNHDPNLVLSGTRNGSLTLKTDKTGLAYVGLVSARIAQTYYGKSMLALLSEGLVTQSSFAFRVAPGGDRWDEDPATGGLIRTIHEIGALFDVSPVTYPAYPDADAGLEQHRRRTTPLLSMVQHRLALRSDVGHGTGPMARRGH